MAGARRGSGSPASTSRNDFEERAEPNRGRRVEVQQSALDEPGEQAGPGLGIGQVGQRAVAHRRERFGHGPSVTPGQDGGRVDRIVSEQPDDDAVAGMAGGP